MINRRSFLSTWSLGGAAAMLSPLVGGIINEAMGQAPRRQLALFYLFGTGFHPDWEFTPEDLKGQALHWAKESLGLALDEADQADEDVFNRILWHSARGDEAPYPATFAGARRATP